MQKRVVIVLDLVGKVCGFCYTLSTLNFASKSKYIYHPYVS